jgi:hypothetical protein
MSKETDQTALQALLAALQGVGLPHQPTYKNRLAAPASIGTTRYHPPDLEQAALGMEYAKRGYQVTYVDRAGLPLGNSAIPEKKGELTRDSLDDLDLSTHRVSLVVDDPASISRLQGEMRAKPQDFEGIDAQAKRHASGIEALERAAATPQPRVLSPGLHP